MTRDARWGAAAALLWLSASTPERRRFVGRVVAGNASPAAWDAFIRLVEDLRS